MESAPKNNPNSIGEILNLGTELPTSPDKVYRSVGTDDAIEDLFAHGEVRNKANAMGTTSQRWGDRVFWSRGEEGKHHGVPSVGHVIEAPHSVAIERPVTKDDVTGIYSRNAEGVVENKLDEIKARLGIPQVKE